MSINSKVLSNPIHFIAFGFGSGLAPLMPGTFGTLAAIPFYFALQLLPWQFYLVTVLFTFSLGIWLCDVTERDIGIPDYPGIVFDEMVGFWCTMFLVPQGWLWIILGFLLFRLFDIWKPWPIRWFNNNIPGGFGIMFDDLLAGCIACIVLHVLIYLKFL